MKGACSLRRWSSFVQDEFPDQTGFNPGRHRLIEGEASEQGGERKEQHRTGVESGPDGVRSQYVHSDIMTTMNAVRGLRRAAAVTQAKLAEAAGTSQATIAAYESGRKSPTVRTLSRLARSVGLEAIVSFHPPMTREDRRSLFLHRVMAAKLSDQSQQVLALARVNLDVMSEIGGRRLLNEWRVILERPVDEIVAVMVDPGVHARDLRQVTPFAGVLSARERAQTYAAFALEEARSA